MPKLYEYFGLAVFFFTNEHDPIHVHGWYQGCRAKAEIFLKNGKVLKILFVNGDGKRPLPPAQMKNFRTLVRAKADDIVRRWVEYFVFQKNERTEKITRKLK
jgi:hypothetical protein